MFLKIVVAPLNVNVNLGIFYAEFSVQNFLVFPPVGEVNFINTFYVWKVVGDETVFHFLRVTVPLSDNINDNNQ